MWVMWWSYGLHMGGMGYLWKIWTCEGGVGCMRAGG